MEDQLENLSISSSSDDLCTRILTKFSNSQKDHHVHLCTAIASISQELKDHSLPLSPSSYFLATLSSFATLVSQPDPASHLVNALSTILSMVLPSVPPPVVRKRSEEVESVIIRAVRSSLGDVKCLCCGLKCLAHLLVVRAGEGSVAWEEVANQFGVILGFVTDRRYKVRRQSHACLKDVMTSFRETSLLSPASEAISSTFERFLLLAGGSNNNASEEPIGAQEVLYLLDALKDCLSRMSTKFSTNILKYFKSLLELHQPLITRRITSALSLLCVRPAVEVSSEVLLDLLYSLAISVSANEISVDDMASTARLLDVGMKRVFSLNRQICVIKLPVVFGALAEIFASEHKEPLLVALEGFKSLIVTCVDESLIRQGVDQIRASNVDMDARRSGPTIIEKVCAIIEGLLDYRYAGVWEFSFQVVATLFDKLGEFSSFFMKATLQNLADMQKLPDNDFPYKKELHACIGSAVIGMGPETFLSILPLKFDTEDFSDSNLWLFPILKQSIIGARLSFFNESLLPIAKSLRQKSAVLEKEGRIYSARTVDGLVYSIWSLLPSFCNYPVDTAESFEDLQKALCTSLREELDVRGLVCSSLQILIQQNRRAMEGGNDICSVEDGICKHRAMARYTPELAAGNMNVLRSSAREILPVLSGIFLKSSGDDGGSMKVTIGELASVADKDVVTKFFYSTMEQLLKVTQEASSKQNTGGSSSMEIDNSSCEHSLSLARTQLFDLAVSILPGLNSKEIDVLFVPVRLSLEDAEGFIQKKAYKVLSIILRNSEGFISRKIDELLDLMFKVLPSCHFSAKRQRLDCLYLLVVHVSKEESEQRRHDVIDSFLTEIILALKEANKKTRNRAYDILVQIGHACGDEEMGGRKENLHHYFKLVAGGLAGSTPHAISAAVKGLARLAYEFTDLVSTAYEVLPSAFLLLQRKNKEVVKASLGLLKVLVTRSQAEGLQTHLRSMVEGLLTLQSSTKKHFHAKVKLLLEMLVKKCGLHAVKEVMPEEHMKLLTNIRKINARKERTHGSDSEGTRSHLSKASTSRLSRWNHTKLFSDYDDKSTIGNTISGRPNKASLLKGSKASSSRFKRTREAGKSLFEKDGEPLDLLDQQKTRSALRSRVNRKRKPEMDDEPEIDSEGRLVIHEGEKRSKKFEMDPVSDVRSQAGSHVSVDSRKSQKQRKVSQSGWAYTGSEYSSKKAGGDVKRKDKLEPYAYWPLDRKMVSRRPEHRAAARKGMASVVKLTKMLEGKNVSNALAVKGLKFKKGKRKNGKSSL